VHAILCACTCVSARACMGEWVVAFVRTYVRARVCVPVCVSDMCSCVPACLLIYIC
jgi:hypothetical protein